MEKQDALAKKRDADIKDEDRIHRQLREMNDEFQREKQPKISGRKDSGFRTPLKS
jgi:hypothetical protein